MNKYNFIFKYAASSSKSSSSTSSEPPVSFNDFINPTTFTGASEGRMPMPAKWLVEDLPGGNYVLNQMAPGLVDLAQANKDFKANPFLFAASMGRAGIDSLVKARSDYINSPMGGGRNPEFTAVKNYLTGSTNNLASNKSYARQVIDALKTRRNMGIAQIVVPSLNYSNWDKDPDKYAKRLADYFKDPADIWRDKAQVARALTSAALIGGGTVAGGIGGYKGSRALANAIGLKSDANLARRLGRYALMSGGTVGGAYLGGNAGAIGAGYLTKMPNAGNNLISVSAQEGTKKHRDEINAMNVPWYQKRFMHLANNLIGNTVDGAGNVLLGTNVFDRNR